MSMSVGGPKRPDGLGSDAAAGAAGADEVIVELNRKKVKLKKSQIKKQAKKLAKHAKDTGMTNDEEALEKDMTETIFKGIQKGASGR